MNNPLSVHEVASKLDGDRLRDYRLEALPSERDALLRRFLTQLASEPPEGRAEIGAGLNDEVRLALTLFAVRMAELAVRQSDQSAILDGLRALVLQWVWPSVVLLRIQRPRTQDGSSIHAPSRQHRTVRRTRPKSVFDRATGRTDFVITVARSA